MQWEEPPRKPKGGHKVTWESEGEAAGVYTGWISAYLWAVGQLPCPTFQLPYILLSFIFLSLTHRMIWSKRIKEGFWVAFFPLQLKSPSLAGRPLPTKPSPPETPTFHQQSHCTFFVSLLPIPNHAIRKSFLLPSDLGFLGTGTHHGFPVFLSHLEALLSLFISLREEIKNGEVWGQNSPQPQPCLLQNHNDH